jgi:very-short-patch-repair endonuclease
MLHRTSNNSKKAKSLRKNMTEEERILWSKIRNKQIGNIKFRRQEPIGNYIVDFVSFEKKLIIEIDGGQHNTSKNIEYDTKRTKYLKEMGFDIIRFWNKDIRNNIEGVITKIVEHISPSPRPSP